MSLCVHIYTQSNPSASLIDFLLLATEEFVFAERQSREAEVKLNIYEIFVIKYLIMIKRRTTSCKPNDKQRVFVCTHSSVALRCSGLGCPFSPPLLAFVSHQPFIPLLFTCPRPWIPPPSSSIISSPSSLYHSSRQCAPTNLSINPSRSICVPLLPSLHPVAPAALPLSTSSIFSPL